MNIEVNAQEVIDHLLEQNKQLVLEIAILQAQLKQMASTTQTETIQEVTN